MEDVKHSEQKIIDSLNKAIRLCHIKQDEESK